MVCYAIMYLRIFRLVLNHNIYTSIGSTLERQGIPAFPSLPPLAGIPTGIQQPLFLNNTNLIVTTPSGQTCICVPAGACSSTPPVGNTDGSGLLDIRIVTNVSIYFLWFVLIIRKRFPYINCKIQWRGSCYNRQFSQPREKNIIAANYTILKLCMCKRLWIWWAHGLWLFG